ncbi:META domain-containing protein [Nocardia takedensis]|uniref:META domain-containing protein n=2 Tax=Nocardia takedensis TaxID=259390 RepID=UPI001FE07367|nr:META domain-containing protein [Nocardia takedensis]
MSTIAPMTALLARLAPLLLASALVAGCSDTESTAEPSTTPTPTQSTTAAPTTTAPPASDTPMGHSYVSTSVEGDPIPGDGQLTLVFAADQLSANAGCNTFAGSVTFDDGVLRTGQLSATLMSCPPPQGDADGWVEGLLSASPAWRLDGSTLTLRTADRTVTLSDKNAGEAKKPLKGTEWVVTGYSTADAFTTSQALTDARPTLTIAEDGAVTGTTGCNRITGGAEVDPSGSPITFRVATTRMACAPEVMEVENAVLRTLDGTATATLEGDTLVLRNANGSGLTLRAA